MAARPARVTVDMPWLQGGGEPDSARRIWGPDGVPASSARGRLLQALQPPLAPDQVAVVPLDLPSLGKPTPEGRRVDLGDRRVPRLGSLEGSFGLEPLFLERLTAPEEQPH